MSAGIRADPSGGKVYIQVDGADVLEVGSTNNIVLPNDGKIGSTGDPDSITVASNGDVTFSQTVFMTDTIAPLHVKNALNNTLLYSNAFNSRIGIKTSSPGKTLDVDGEIRTSSGILFGTDTAAANTLDDYEEGTWTPAYDFSSSGSATTINTYGRYTRVGNVVNFWCRIATASISSPTGNARITGLPFVSNSTADYRAGVAIGAAIDFATAKTNLFAYVSNNESQVSLLDNNTDGGTSFLTGADFSSLSGDNILILGGSYEAA